MARPWWPVEIWWFWQKKHWLEQPLKKIVPEPCVPENHGSSPKCGPKLATRHSAVSPQKPSCPAARCAPQSRGHNRHDW
jgi:hypothetical protein